MEAMITRSCGPSLLLVNRRGRSRPRAFPMAPNRDVVKPERVPPQIKHRLVETQDSCLRDACRRRSELSQPVVDEDSLPLVDTRQQMPHRECVPFARLTEHDLQIFRAFLRCAVFKIESRQSGAEASRRILEVRRARTDFWPGRASCARWDEGLAAIQLESDPPERCAHQPRARIVHLQDVSTTQIDRHSRWRVDDELPCRRPNVGMNCSAIKGNP